MSIKYKSYRVAYQTSWSDKTHLAMLRTDADVPNGDTLIIWTDFLSKQNNNTPVTIISWSEFNEE